jgi:hypothetical protein
MHQLWQNLFAVAFVLTWAGGVLILGIRANAKGKAYLRRLPPAKGVPLDMYMYGEHDWFRGWRGPVWRAYRQQQADPELELLRQEARRRGRYVTMWIFTFPAVVLGLLALLIVTGVLR